MTDWRTLSIPEFEHRIARILANQTGDEWRHAKWLEKQRRDGIRARQRKRKVPSARDLDAIAEEERIRQATTGRAVLESEKFTAVKYEGRGERDSGSSRLRSLTAKSSKAAQASLPDAAPALTIASTHP